MKKFIPPNYIHLAEALEQTAKSIFGASYLPPLSDPESKTYKWMLVKERVDLGDLPGRPVTVAQTEFVKTQPPLQERADEILDKGKIRDMQVGEAAEKLQQSLYIENINSFKIDMETGNREAIENNIWGNRYAENMFSLSLFDGSPIILDEDQFDRFLSTGHSASKRSSPKASTALGVTKCTAWLIEKMKAGPPPDKKAVIRDEALNSFSITKNSFNRAWKNSLEESGDPYGWTKGGRPKLKA
jgi:hypothetical protein